MPEEKKTMSVPEAGKYYFGLSMRTSYKLAKTGELPGVMRIGGKLRVSVPALEQSLRDVDFNVVQQLKQTLRAAGKEN